MSNIRTADTSLEQHILNKLGLAKDDAQYIALLCKELNIPPVLGMHGIYAVKGKPFLSANVKRSVILKSGHTFVPIELTPEECVIRAGRKGQDTFDFRFSRKYAQAIGRTKASSAWNLDPMTMCLHACTHLVARAIFPDLFLGFGEDPEYAAAPEAPEAQSQPTISLDAINEEKDE